MQILHRDYLRTSVQEVIIEFVLCKKLHRHYDDRDNRENRDYCVRLVVIPVILPLLLEIRAGLDIFLFLFVVRSVVHIL